MSANHDYWNQKPRSVSRYHLHANLWLLLHAYRCGKVPHHLHPGKAWAVPPARAWYTTIGEPSACARRSRADDCARVVHGWWCIQGTFHRACIIGLAAWWWCTLHRGLAKRLASPGGCACRARLQTPRVTTGRFFTPVLPGGNFRDFVNRGEQMECALHKIPNSEIFQNAFSVYFHVHNFP